MIHFPLFETWYLLVYNDTLYCAVPDNLRGKPQFPHNKTDLAIDKIIFLQTIPACGAVCHILCHFSGMRDLQEAEMMFMCK